MIGGDLMKISTRARILRAQKYGRMERFAEAAGVPATGWKNFEAGRAILSNENLAKAAVALGVKTTDLADMRGFPVGV